MPKISEYPALTAAESAVGDILPIVDVSASGTGNPGGTTKKITVAELKAALSELNGVVVSGTPSAAGKILKATSTTAASWQDDAGGAGVTVRNNLTTTTPGDALDAVQGKALKDTADALASTVAGKQATLVSATNIKTVNGNSLLGSGDLTVSGGGGLGSVTLTGTPAAGQVVKATGPTAATWQDDATGTAIPDITSTVNLTVTTTATPNTGAYVALPSQACTSLVVENTGRFDLDYQRDATGAFITIQAGCKRTIVGITNANQIAFRRSDWAVPVQTRTGVVLAVQARTGGRTNSAVSARAAAPSGGGYTVFSAGACVCMELINISGKVMRYRLNAAGTDYYSRPQTSVMIHGITNANQVGIRTGNSTSGGIRDVQAEIFGVVPEGPLHDFRFAESLSDQAVVRFEDIQTMAAFPKPHFMTLPMLKDRQFLGKKGKRVLAQFKSVAEVTSSAIATLFDVATPETVFGLTALEYVQASTAGVSIRPLAALSVPVDVRDGSIHFSYAFPQDTVQYVGSAVTIAIRLYSTGDPSSAGSNYHQGTLNSNWGTVGFVSSGATGNGIIPSCWSIPSSAFAAVGSGADLSNIIFATIVVTGSSGYTGARFRPFEVSFVPHARSKAAVVFTFDDISPGHFTNILPTLAKYGYPAVLCIDDMVSWSASTGGSVLTLAQALSMQNNHGWQLTFQQYDGYGNGSYGPQDYLLTASKGVQVLNSLGAFGVQDTSNMNTTDEANSMGRRLFRTNMLFNGANNTSTPMPPQTLPFADPYRIMRMNMSSSFTAGTLYDRWKDLVDIAVANKGVAIFAAHSEFATAGNEANLALDSLCAYIRTLEAAGVCDVHTMDSLIREVYGPEEMQVEKLTLNLDAPLQIAANLTITAANAQKYNGRTVEFTGAYSITISAGITASIPGFRFTAIPPSSGNASIVSDGTALLNGATTTLTRAASNPTFNVIARGSAANSFVVTGS